MQPYIYIGDLELPVYGIIIFISYIAGLFICSSLGKQYGINGKYILCSGTFAAAGLLIGAKVLYMATKLPSFIMDYDGLISQYNISQKLSYLLGGYVFYGGLIGAVMGILIFCKAFGFDKGSMLNILTPLIPFAHSFGRIGCFFGGCCYGIEYHGFMAVSFPYNPLSPELNLVPRFPVQLAEAFLNFMLFIFLFIYTKKKAPACGRSFGIYLVCYSIIRFFLEFLRGDIVRGMLLGLSTSQWISVILFPIGLTIIQLAKKADAKM